MSAPGSPSLLARLRGTSSNIKKKFRKAQSLPPLDATSPPLTPSLDNSRFEFYVEEVGNRPPHAFTCRYLGEMSIYTLNPEHCYGFAESLAKNCLDSDTHNKRNIVIREGHIHIASTERRQFNKRLSKRHNFNNINASRTPPLRLKNEALHSSGSSSPLHQRYPKSAPLLGPRPRTFSFEDMIAEDVFQKEPYVQDCSISGSNTPQVSVLTPVPDPERRNISCTTVFEFPNSAPASLSQPMKTVHENSRQNVPVTIPLHDIAYCVTVPSNQRVFLLTSRQGTCLVCRVYLFHRREKAQALTLALAKQFEKSYLEWQKIKQVKRKQSLVKAIEKTAFRKTGGLKVIEQNNNVANPEITDEANKENNTQDTDVYSSPEESSDVELNGKITVEMSREFTRRASCLEIPERLELGDGMTMEKLEKSCENMMMSSDGFTTDEDKDSDESTEHGNLRECKSDNLVIS